MILQKSTFSLTVELAALRQYLHAIPSAGRRLPFNISDRRAACVTCLAADTRRVPDNGGSIPATRAPKYLNKHNGCVASMRQPKNKGNQRIVTALLRKSGQPEGRLLMIRGTLEAATFRLDARPRPCSVAQIWRPADPMHRSNGAYLTYDSTRAVILKCLHLECQKLNRGSGDSGTLFRLPTMSLCCTPGGRRTLHTIVADAKKAL